MFRKNSAERLLRRAGFSGCAVSRGLYININTTEVMSVLCPQRSADSPQRHVLLGVPGAHVRGYCAGSGLEALLHSQQSHGGSKVHRRLTRPSEGAG